MMPLYVGGDLPLDADRAIGKHLATCEGCCQFADEFRDSQNLLAGELATPAFERDFYEEIRHTVLAEIAQQDGRSKSFFGTRWIYAIAVAVLVVGFTFLVGLWHKPAQKPVLLSGTVNSDLNDDGQRGRGSSITLPPKFPHSRAVKESTRHGKLAQALRKHLQIPGSTEVPPAASFVADSPSRAELSRIEIQTGNPNIRIIWLAQEDSRPVQGDTREKDEPRDRE